jgi:DNA-binding SARP family transcriptional activator
MLELVKGLQTLSMNQSRSYYLDQFFATKYQEIAAVFQSSRLASQAFDVLAQVDPAHMSEYNRMME